MPPLYDVIGPVKAHGKLMREGRVELPESVGSRLVIDGYLTLAGAEFAAPVFDGLLGSPSLPLVTDLPDGDKLLAADLVRRTFDESKLSIEEWNALPQEDRDDAIVDELDEILYGLQLKDFERDELLHQNNRDPGDEHTPPREIATQTQPSDDQGRVNGSITGEGGGAPAPSPKPSIDSEAQGSGPQTEGDASANPPIGGGTDANPNTRETEAVGSKAPVSAAPAPETSSQGQTSLSEPTQHSPTAPEANAPQAGGTQVNDGGKMEAPGQPVKPEAGAGAPAASAPKSKAKPTTKSSKK